MASQLNLQSKDERLYVPEKATITKIERFTATEKFFRVELDSGRSLGHDPGQFVQVSLLGIGEAPISISSPPGSDNSFEMCIRAVGTVTNKLHTLNEGDKIFIRGPFGAWIRTAYHGPHAGQASVVYRRRYRLCPAALAN